jgi:A/G-specific adenine glycosylase
VRRVVARLVHGRAEAGNARAADLDDVLSLTPPDPGRAARFSVAAMELGALVCVAGTPRCGACPVRDRCAWRLAGCPPHDGPPRRVQKFAGTDRQVRGRLLDVLRAAHAPVDAAALEPAWDDAVQRSRCLDSLLADGLVEQTPDGRFGLPQN